jgi:predicted nicotinamide N-methyase
MSVMSSLFMSSLPSEADFAQQKAYVTYAFPHHHPTDDSVSDDRTVTLLEARSVISSSGTTGLRTWEAALLLGSYLASDVGQSMIRGQRVFELGAGTGMLSILCAKHLEIAGIVATDGDEAVVDTIKTNCFLNGLDVDGASTCIVRTAALKWGRRVDATTFAEDYGMEAPGILLGADVVSSKTLLWLSSSLTKRSQTYDSSVIPRLVTTLSEFFELNPALEVLISATIRNEKTFETFLNACSGSFSSHETAALRYR